MAKKSDSYITFNKDELERISQDAKAGNEPVLFKKVENPNLYEDLHTFLGLNINIDQVKSMVESLDWDTREKIANFMERIEFIEHLQLVDKHLANLKYEIDGQEVHGIGDNIHPLRIYLILEAITLFAPFEDFKTWLRSQVRTLEGNETVKHFFNRKIEEYETDFGQTRYFRSVFINLPELLKKQITDNIQVIVNGTSTRELPEIVKYLIDVRNKYTHQGLRFFLFPNRTFGQILFWNTENKKSLIVRKGIDLIDLLHKVARNELIQLFFKKYHELTKKS